MVQSLERYIVGCTPRVKGYSPGRPINLTQALLVGADLTGANLEGARLYQAIATGLIAPEARFAHCDLTYADLSGANLTRANFGAAVLASANLHAIQDEGAYIPNRAAAKGTDPDRLRAETWHAR